VWHSRIRSPRNSGSETAWYPCGYVVLRSDSLHSTWWLPSLPRQRPESAVSQDSQGRLHLPPQVLVEDLRRGQGPHPRPADGESAAALHGGPGAAPPLAAGRRRHAGHLWEHVRDHRGATQVPGAEATEGGGECRQGHQPHQETHLGAAGSRHGRIRAAAHAGGKIRGGRKARGGWLCRGEGG